MHDTGSGPALLFLHAFPLDASQWDHQVAAISADHRCLRPDMWGCGWSPPPPDDPPSLDAYAHAVLDALDERRVDRFGAVGLSLGGYIALALLRIAAPRILSLTLCNTRAGADTPEGRADRLALADRVLDSGSVEALVEPNVERLLSARSRGEAHVTDPLRARIRRCTPAGVAYAARAMAARPDSSALLPSVAAPTLVIAGRDDSVIPLAEMQALAGAVRGGQLVEMSCGHLSNLEDPHGFTAHLQRFLAASMSDAR